MIEIPTCLNEDDKNVLKTVYETSLATGKTLLNMSELLDRFGSLGITKEMIQESLEMLNGFGYIRAENSSIGMLAVHVTGRGFGYYVDAFEDKYLPLFRSVGDQLVNTGTKSNLDISKSLEQPLIAINLIIDYYKEIGHLNISKTSGSTFIGKSSVEFKRAFRKT
jgi:hypothetical protein